MDRNKSRLWIVIVIVTLNSIGFSIVLPLLPFIVGEFLPEHQVVVGMNALLSIFAACTFFAAPVFGALSDRYGRKKILMISLLGSVVGYALFGLAESIEILFFARIIDGLTAGNISVLFAYISDTAASKDRTKWFGYIGAAMGIGKIGGPALGGVLGDIDLGLPFFVTAGLIFISGIAVYFLLPESLSVEKRTKQVSLNNFNTFSYLKSVFKLKNIRFFLFLSILFYVGIGVFQFNFALFLKDIFHWTPFIIGSVLTVVGVFEIITRAFVLPSLLNKVSEKRIGIMGLFGLSIGLGLIFISFYFQSWSIIILAVIFIVSGEGLFEPTYLGKLSQLVNENQQGKIQGINQSLLSLNNMIVPIGVAAIYLHSPGLLYFITMLIVLIAIVLYWKYSSNYDD